MDITADLYFFYAFDIVAFLLYGWDKCMAVMQRRRIPEALLLTVAGIGGAFGALCGMIFFRHKTRHRLFLFLVPVFVGLHLAIAILLRLSHSL